MAKNRVEVTINSRQYAILADESEEYIKKLAEHIDEKVKTVIKGGQNVLGERPMVLAALNICDEYYKCFEAGSVLKNQLAACSKKLETANDEIRKLREGQPQVSFDEQEAEAKLKKAGDKLKATEEKLSGSEDKLAAANSRLKSAEGKIEALEARIKELEANSRPIYSSNRHEKRN